MSNNKVSEKAVWEGSITPDENVQQAMPHIHTQPQMMFCYKCNNVIPSDSRFCPYCQIQLFIKCPKCGANYSSQYPACSKCGTNREEYRQMQRREAERKAAIEREIRRQREIEERKRLEAKEEKERQERLKRYEQEANERQQKEAYLKENAEIMKTKEYVNSDSLLNEALKALEDKWNKNTKKSFLFLSIPLIYLVVDICYIDLANHNLEMFFTIVVISCIIGVIGFIVTNVKNNDRESQEKYLMQYASRDSRYHESLISTRLISMVWYQRNVSDCCIIAYREKHKLPIHYKWHNMRKD